MTTMTTLADIAALIPGSTLAGDGARAISRVHTDTRTLRAGDLFVALKGERFDAHEFLPQAKAAGAVAAIASHGLAEAGLDGVRVDDPLAALQTLATGWRRRFDAPVIAVAGSNGKTTVTQMIASILRAAYADRAHSTAGNLNNHIGVPLTVLGLRPAHRAAVVELGMNHPGEIAVLARIAQPTVALVNNAQREHQEFMATVEAVAHENGAAIEALADDGVAVFPAGDAHESVWLAQAGGRRLLRFALVDDEAGAAGPQAEVAGRARWADGVWRVEMQTPLGAATLALRLAGLHNVRNALASAAAAIGAGVALADIVRGLEAFEPVKGRSQVKSLVRDGRARTLVDDTYNANPDSVRAAIDVLAGLPGPRWLVLGDMGEVGDQGPAFHAEIGAYAAARGIEAFWCAGALCVHAASAYGGGARHFADTGALLAALASGDARHAPPPFESALVKGSRFMAMERVVAQLLAPPASSSAGGGHAA
jgi:UDP-N-acetylmuramoyl-tripeptide--D-alanyl-D-alanine ligase